jgi:signal transduction histidine kinase
MPLGRTLTLDAANTVLKNATGAPVTDGDYVCISVSDSGEGMPCGTRLCGSPCA